MGSQGEIVWIEGKAGKLEGRIANPGGGEKELDVVICHPHPQYGGSMENNVVNALFDFFQDEGFRVLKFNFRGAGRSEGYFHGEDEIHDVHAALDFLLRNKEGGYNRQGMLVGYSFGAWVVARAVTENERIKVLIGVAPPVNMLDFHFLEGISLPTLFVFGGNDTFASPSVAEELKQEIKASWMIDKIPGADHFFLGYEDRILQPIKTFLKSIDLL